MRRRPAHSILVVLLVITSTFVAAQVIHPRYNFKQLNVQNGLTQNIVYHFLGDSYGYMWIGTHNGLNLYDGTRTINFLHSEQDTTSIGGNFITCLLEDSSSQIWIGHENGIDLYNRVSNTFTHFGVLGPGGTLEKTFCVPLGFVTADLWFLDTQTKSILSLNVKTKKSTLVSGFGANNALFFKSQQTHAVHLWSSYEKGTIHQVYKNNTLIKEQTYFLGENKSVDPELIVHHVLQQNDTTVWLSTNKGLVKLNPASNRYEIIDRFEGQIVRELRFAAISNKGELWVASGPDGVYVFNIKTNEFVDHFKNDKFDPFSVCSDNIVSLYFDKTGNAWCGSYGNGLSYANTENNLFASHISKKETQAWGGNNHISLMGTDPKGNIWCTFENTQKLCLLDKNFQIRRFENILNQDGTIFNDAMYELLFQSDDEAWCATNKGLFIYNIHTNKLRPIKYELVSDQVMGSIWIWNIIRLQDSSLMFSTFGGLYHLMIVSGKIVIQPIKFLKEGIFNGFGTMYQDRSGLIYIKDLGDYLYILKPVTENNSYELVKSILFPPEVNQFFNNKTDTVVYIASEDGLYHIDVKSMEIKKESFSNKMPFLNISSAFKTEDKFWIFGEKGLYCYDEKNNVGRTFTIEDGLPANDFGHVALTFDLNNRCIAGTSNGLVSFFPNQLKYSSYSPRPQLTGIYINDTLYGTAPNPNEIKKINLSFTENTFAFDFSTIAFNNIADCSFEYKLDNYDEGWIKSGAAHYTRYSKIPPGNYVFNLRVADATGKISPFIKTLDIQIAKAYWQTTIFKLAVLAFILLLGWSSARWYFSYKISKQKRKFEKQQVVEKERTRIATDMHDDLGAGLSRIKFLSETIGIKKQQQQPIEEDISKIREYSHAMIDKMGEIVWALNEKNDSLSDLLSYTRVYAMEYLSQNGIACNVEAPEQFPTSFVSGEFRRNVYLTAKEALHNIVKHAQASSVNIKILANQKLEFIIRDNGVGFDKTNIRPFSNGLMNMEKRIKEIGGEFLILHENGTTIIIRVPLPL